MRGALQRRSTSLSVREAGRHEAAGIRAADTDSHGKHAVSLSVVEAVAAADLARDLW